MQFIVTIEVLLYYCYSGYDLYIQIVNDVGGVEDTDGHIVSRFFNILGVNGINYNLTEILLTACHSNKNAEPEYWLLKYILCVPLIYI